MNCGFEKHCSSLYPLQNYISVSPFHNTLFFFYSCYVKKMMGNKMLMNDMLICTDIVSSSGNFMK